MEYDVFDLRTPSCIARTVSLECRCGSLAGPGPPRVLSPADNLTQSGGTRVARINYAIGRFIHVNVRRSRGPFDSFASP